ncbi:MAG: hypothetical protein JXR83_13025 [Deltaproteobacteria bacterium]|nr:hypothetical protein [Deltaproteobacteria bacterium]
MAAKPKLDRQAQRAREIVSQRDANGNPLYSRREVRDFLVACCFELGWPITPEVQPLVLEVLSEIKVPVDASDEMIVAGVKSYFVANPVNQRLVMEFGEFGRGEALSGAKGYKDRSEQLKALRTTGRAEKLKAPADKGKKRKPRLKRGIK